MEFTTQLQQRKDEIEKLLTKAVPEENSYQELIFEAMNYSLMAGGKRLRPMLMLETYHLFGGTQDEIVLPFMKAMEMIHTYSLVHDDLPAMDNDEYRRGRKTTHIVYGHAMGVLAGDALLNYAFETIANGLTNLTGEDLQNGVKAFQVVAKKAGVYGMIGGQVVDVLSTEKSMEQDKLDFIYRLKTGALIEASILTGAILAGADDATVDDMQKVALSIGMAFQIQDDILDVTSTTEILGKPVGSDEKNHKLTYVALHGLEKSREDVRRLSEEALAILRSFETRNEFLEELVQFLITREK